MSGRTTPAEDPIVTEHIRGSVNAFYTAFARADAGAMVQHYHPEVRFTDPVFGELDREHVGAMWHMLCERGSRTGLQVEHGPPQVIGDRAIVEWEARYRFGAKGRAVHNRIHAEMIFKDGAIIRHTDHFDTYRWAGQAFGPLGHLLGWTGFFRDRLRKRTRALLEAYMRKGA